MNSLIIGAALGGLVIGLISYLTVRYNSGVKFGDIQAQVKLLEYTERQELEVTYKVIASSKCPSWSQHLLYQNIEVKGRKERFYVPLGITVNGVGAEPLIKRYKMAWIIPSYLKPGEWWYTVVTSASCEWLPGFIRQELQETTPVEITIPPA